MNRESDFIIERKLKFDLGGTVVSGKLRLGPIKSRGRSFGCYCFLSHYERRGRWIYGEDPLQALMLGLKYLRFLLDRMASRGVVVWYCERGDNGALETI